MRQYLPPTIFWISLLALVICWEVCARAFFHLHFILPAPSVILSELISRPGLFLFHGAATLRVMLYGFLLAFNVALPLAWCMAEWQRFNQALQPLMVVLKCIPMFTLAPIMVLWFGWSIAAMVVPTAMMVVVPLTISIYGGLCSTPQHLLDYFALNGASRWQTLIKLRLPWAMPQIFSGLRIASAMAGVGAIAGEWAGAQRGLGVLMLETRVDAEIATTFGALLCLTAITLALYGCVVLTERLCLTGIRRVRRLTALPLALLFSLVMVGMTTDTSRATTRLVLDWHPNPNHVPLFVGIEQGYFAEEGIDLEILRLRDPGDGIPLLTSGMTDLAIGYAPGTVKAQSEGAQVEIVATLLSRPLNCLMFRKGEGIEKLDDLHGKTFGYSSGSKGPRVLQALLADAKIIPGELRNVSFDLTTSLGAGLVDVVYGACWNVEPVQLSALGVEVDWITVEQMGMPTYPALVILTCIGSDYDAEPKRQVLQRALQRSIDFCRQHPDQAFSIYARQQDKAEITLAWERQAWENTLPLIGSSAPPAKEIMDGLKRWHDRHGLLGSLMM